MSPEVSPLMSVVSLAGSIGSLAATAYVWLVRFNKERPRLSLYPSSPGCGVDASTLRGDQRHLAFRLSAVIANDSSLPNAIIDAAVDMPSRDGSWREIENPRITTSLPLNVAPMSTTLISLEWMVGLSAIAALEDGPKEKLVTGYCAHYFNNPCLARLSVLALREREFDALIPLES